MTVIYGRQMSSSCPVKPLLVLLEKDRRANTNASFSALRNNWFHGKSEKTVRQTSDLLLFLKWTFHKPFFLVAVAVAVVVCTTYRVASRISKLAVHMHELLACVWPAYVWHYVCLALLLMFSTIKKFAQQGLILDVLLLRLQQQIVLLLQHQRLWIF